MGCTLNGMNDLTTADGKVFNRFSTVCCRFLVSTFAEELIYYYNQILYSDPVNTPSHISKNLL